MARDIFQPVGQGCPNLPPDIMTLQMLLNDVADLWIEKPGDCRFSPVDGQITQQFQAALAKFQERSNDMKMEGNKIQPGGFTVSRLNAWQQDKPLSREGTYTCIHGAPITIISTGKVDLRLDTLGVNAVMMVAGCPNMIGPQPAPCMTARFLSSPNPNLVSQSTPSLVIGAMGPSGPMMVVNPGTRYV